MTLVSDREGRTQRRPSESSALARRASRSRPRRGQGAAGAQPLGWFSLALGLSELVMPERVAKLAGVPGDGPHRSLIRAAGLREVGSGLGILGADDPTGWVWSRLAGDVMDLALLGAALGSPRTKLSRWAFATASVLGVTAADYAASRRLYAESAPRSSARGGIAVREREEVGLTVRQAITVRRPPAEVYAFFRNFENLGRGLSHLESLEVTGPRTARWRMRGPLGVKLEWETQVTLDEPERHIAWQSLPGADIVHTGEMRFRPAPGDRGTEVEVQLHYRPPAGSVGRAFAQLLEAIPRHQIQRELRTFKQVIELGEVVHSDASIHRLPHPGRPPTAQERSLAEARSSRRMVGWEGERS